MKDWIYRHEKLVAKVMKIGILIGGCMLLTVPTLADVGNNVDYSSGGSGSGSSSSSSFSVDPYTIMYMMRWIMRDPWLLIPIGLVLFLMWSMRRHQNGLNRSSSSTSSSHSGGGRDYRGYSDMPMAQKGTLNKLMQSDPQFSEQMLVSKVNNMFMRLQLAWMNKKWEEARPFETDALFNTHKMQLDQYIASHRTNRIEDIAVLNTDILKYYVLGNFEYLDVAIKARFVDYVVEDGTDKLIKGDKFRSVHMQYVWKLVRKQGIPTNETHVEATACPNCGANLSINQAGRCEYCGSIVTKGDFDWVLSEIEVIAQHK